MKPLLAWTAALVVVVVPARTLALQDRASQSDRQLKAAVQRAVAEVGGPRLTVEVSGGGVTLTGEVPTLWSKQEAIKRALKAAGVPTIVSEVTIGKAESDEVLVREVADRIRKYDRYSVYDDIEGRIRNGVVSLTGAVTAPEKLSDILERVARVRGVQDINNKIQVLPVSRSDDRLRVIIATAIYRDQAFENYSMVDPPVHVIVENGHVTLTGFVRSEVERIKAESIARSFTDVLTLANKVQVVGKQR